MLGHVAPAFAVSEARAWGNTRPRRRFVCGWGWGRGTLLCHTRAYFISRKKKRACVYPNRSPRPSFDPAAAADIALRLFLVQIAIALELIFFLGVLVALILDVLVVSVLVLVAALRGR